MKHIMLDRYNLLIDEELVNFEEVLDNLITTGKLLGYSIFFDCAKDYDEGYGSEEEDSINIRFQKGEDIVFDINFHRNKKLHLINANKFTPGVRVSGYRRDYMKLMEEVLVEL